MADEPQAGSPNNQGGETPPVAPEAPAPRTAESYESEINQLRKEAAKARVEKQEISEQLKSVLAGGDPAALKTAAEEAVRRAEAAEQQAREISIRAQLERQAHSKGLVDVDAAVKLLDHGALKIGDDGVVTNAEKALDDLVAAKPWLKPAAPTTPPAAPGATNPPAGTRTTLTRDEVRKMTPEQINANWPIVEAALKTAG